MIKKDTPPLLRGFCLQQEKISPLGLPSQNSDIVSAAPRLNGLSIKAAITEANTQLNSVSDSAMLDAELLLSHCLDKNRSYLHTWPEQVLSDDQADCFQRFIQKRLTDYPVAYLLGTKSFWTLELDVNPDVLIPRPETELLVEIALEKIEAIKNPKILDLGTGSGAIALSIASERKDANIFAVDNSIQALDVAKNNANKLHLNQRITFQQSDWFSNITKKVFDLIVSNPPYISSDDPHLQQSIRHEPQAALVADNIGIKDIQTIVEKSRDYLKKDAWLMLEHGYAQSTRTLELLNANHYKNAHSRKDLNGILRVSLARYGG